MKRSPVWWRSIVGVMAMSNNGTARLKYLVTDDDLEPFAWERTENNLVDRVAAARKLGVSYGQYMAMLKDGAVEDPLAGGEE